MTPQGPQITACAEPLARRLGPDADAVQIAAAVLAVWREIEAALTPIVGTLGVAALYKRSLHLTSAAHPWLASTRQGMHVNIDLAALEALLLQQHAAAGAAGGGAFLQNFHALLASLVGTSLTERLLRSVWANASTAATAQDTPP